VRFEQFNPNSIWPLGEANMRVPYRCTLSTLLASALLITGNITHAAPATQSSISLAEARVIPSRGVS